MLVELNNTCEIGLTLPLLYPLAIPVVKTAVQAKVVPMTEFKFVKMMAVWSPLQID